MDFRLTPEQEAFRREVEEFLARELPAERREILDTFMLAKEGLS